jgi:hypothetical protein
MQIRKNQHHVSRWRPSGSILNQQFDDIFVSNCVSFLKWRVVVFTADTLALAPFSRSSRMVSWFPIAQNS